MDPKKILPASLLLLAAGTLVSMDVYSLALHEGTRLLLDTIALGAAGALGFALRGVPKT